MPGAADKPVIPAVFDLHRKLPTVQVTLASSEEASAAGFRKDRKRLEQQNCWGELISQGPVGAQRVGLHARSA